MKKVNFIFSIFVAFIFFPKSSLAQIMGEVEGSVVKSGYNNIRIPGDEGTLFKLTDNFTSNLQPAFRLRAGYRFNNKHNLYILFAPLKVKYQGSFNQPITYYKENFGSGVPTEVIYVFNSYRITYRYDFITTSRLRVGAGLTGKVRDAYIEIEQTGKRSKKDNVGIVPLINLMVQYNFNENVSLLLEGDGLATNMGRAFDFQLSVPVNFNNGLGAKLGYRVLEGGANNKEVYNFTRINYFQAGLFYNFY